MALRAACSGFINKRLHTHAPHTVTPPTLHGGGTAYALQCNAVQFSSHPMTGHLVATCDLPQPAAPTPHGWTSRRATAGRSRSAGQELFVRPFSPFFCLGSAFLADLGRRRRCDTPTMPPIRAMPGVGNGYTGGKGCLSRGAATSRCHGPSGRYVAG